MPLSEHTLEVLREALFLSDDATEAEALRALVSNRRVLEQLVDGHAERGIDDPALDAAVDVIREHLDTLPFLGPQPTEKTH